MICSVKRFVQLKAVCALFFMAACGQSPQMDMTRINAKIDRQAINQGAAKELNSKNEFNYTLNHISGDSQVSSGKLSVTREESEVIDLTAGDIFLSGNDVEMKAAGHSVFIESNDKNGPESTRSGQFQISLPLHTQATDSGLNLTQMSMEKRPDWLDKCEIILMYQRE